MASNFDNIENSEGEIEIQNDDFGDLLKKNDNTKLISFSVPSKVSFHFESPEPLNETDEQQNLNFYEVVEGDTLQSIVTKFNMTVDQIRRLNNNITEDSIKPGLVLTVEKNKIEPMHLEMTSSDFSAKTLPGVLQVINDHIFFQPDDIQQPPLFISLLGFLEIVILPHPKAMSSLNVSEKWPSSTPTIFMISYLENPNNPNSGMCEAYFSTTNENSNKLKNVIQPLALQIQKEHDFTPPDPSTISIKKDNYDWSDINENAENKNNEDYEKKEHKFVGASSLPFSFFSLIKLPKFGSKQPEPLVEPEIKPRRRRLSSFTSKIQLLPCESLVINDFEVNDLRSQMPYRYRNCNWNLLYQLSKHGTSYRTFFNCTEKAMPVVLLIKTDNGDKIGAYISSGLKFSKRYYGTGETFVFRFNPKCESFKWSEGSNQFFVTSTSTEIGLGGGGSSAIWIDGDLFNGISEPCSTFNSPQLTKEYRFKCIEIEVWGFTEKKSGYTDY